MTGTPEMPARNDALDALFRPRSVAIVGASGDANKVGGRPIAFLKRAGWRGRLLPVNPSAAEVQGIAAYRSLEQIDEPIEQAIVAVPAAQVLAVADACIGKGVKALQIFSAGFGEGADAAHEQALLARKARAAGVRVLGPNSLGLFNAIDGYFGTFATALDGAWPRAGPVGVATQSGAFGSYFFGMAQRRGLGFSHFVATGNESDIDVADCIAFMATDPHTRIVVLAMEGCRDGRKLAEALHAVRRAGKPVLAMKVGVSAAGQRAALTHTGALAGEERVFDAVLRDCGAHRAASLEALVDAACVASLGPLPPSRDLLVVTTSGGIGVLAADAAEAAALALPPVTAGARDDIRAIAPLADGANPVDTSAGILGDVSAYARIAARALDDRPYGAALCYLAHLARNPAHWARVREPLYALRARHPRIAFAAVLLADDAIAAELREHGFSVFEDPSRAVAALAACAPAPAHPSPSTDASPALETHARCAAPVAAHVEAAPFAAHTAAAARATNDRAWRIDGPIGTEAQAKAALAALGVRFAPERLVCDANEAAAAARTLGYPVVLKIVSPDIAHKTEAGGVRRAIADEAALRDALPAMRDAVLAHRPGARIDGFLVARELRGGVEVLVGAQRDPVFGPVIAVGAGGVLAELLDDVQVRLAPIDEATARAMLHATRVVGPLCAGWRGEPAADLGALAQQVARVSEIAWANRDRIAGIELNPVLALPAGAYALDALIDTRPEATS